jgi:glycosyltransferase involved in cell wall biosynthesis
MKRPLNIFVPHCSDLLTDHLPHGDGLIAYGFISHLARRGHRVHVAVQRIDLREPLGPNVTIHRVPGDACGRIVGRVAYMRRLRRLFWQLKEQFRFDLIHQLNPVFTGLSLALAGSGLPLVLGTYVARWPAEQTSGMSESRMDQLRAYGRDAISALQQWQADTLVLTTPAAENRLPSAEGVRDRVHFLPHGVDTDLFSPGPDRGFDGGCIEDQRGPSILFLANVVRRKGIFTLIDAFHAVACEFPEVRLRIAGDGPDLPEAKQRVARLSCADRVDFLGRQERGDAPACYRNCSVYCLPSFGEPYATTVIEAMSCGTPLVVTNAGGLPHMISKEGGICVPPGNTAALAGALSELLRDPRRRAAMGRHNRRVVETTMSWGQVAEQLENIYEITLSRSKNGGNRGNNSAVVFGGREPRNARQLLTCTTEHVRRAAQNSRGVKWEVDRGDSVDG